MPLRSLKYSRTFDESGKGNQEKNVMATISSNNTHKTNMVTVDEEFYFETATKDPAEILQAEEYDSHSKSQIAGYRQSSKDTVDDSRDIQYAQGSVYFEELQSIHEVLISRIVGTLYE